MPTTEIWEHSSGGTLEVTPEWPGEPLLAGSDNVMASAANALESIRTPRESWTIPDLDSEFERALVLNGFSKVAYRTRFSLAETHLKSAVRQAETSTREFKEALELMFRAQEERRQRSEKGGDPPIDVLTSLRWTVSLDRALEAARTTVILATSSLEAFINERALDAPWSDANLERSQLPLKWLLVPQLIVGSTFDKGAEPYQSFVSLIRLRNKLVHGRAETRILEIAQTSDADAFVAANFARPEWDVKPESGRWACSVVREMCLAYCNLVDESPPRYLAYVPAEGPSDIRSWLTATIMTGARADPDIPARPTPFWE